MTRCGLPLFSCRGPGYFIRFAKSGLNHYNRSLVQQDKGAFPPSNGALIHVTTGEEGFCMFKYFKGDSGKASLKTMIIIVLVLLFALFLFQNSESVEIRFFFWKMTLSKIFLVLSSFVLGGLIGLWAGWDMSRKKRSV